MESAQSGSMYRVMLIDHCCDPEVINHCIIDLPMMMNWDFPGREVDVQDSTEHPAE